MKAVFFLLSLLALHCYAQKLTPTDDEYILWKNVENGANEFAVKLFKKVTINEPGNFIISPFSVYMTLAMVSYGAVGETKEELHKVLHLPKRTIIESLGTLTGILDVNYKLQSLRSVILRIGNKILVASDVSLNDDYQTVVNYAFNSRAERVNFRNPLEAATLINAWSSRFTAGKIRKIVTAEQLDDSTRLMLINSAYFLGKWKVPFDPESTSFVPFYVNSHVVKNVPMMRQYGRFQIGELPRNKAYFIALPYQDNGNQEDATYMYIILPKQRNGPTTLEDIIDYLTFENLQITREYELELLLPKFTIESTFNLENHLYQLGIKHAFTDSANFGAMTKQRENLKISQVAQKAFISIDERGTEAAALSAIMIGSKMGRSTIFKIDRPFLVVVATRDIILFTGKVVDPCLKCSLRTQDEDGF